MTTYKRLGDYIREVNVRNRELKVTKPMGINIDKHFMPSVAIMQYTTVMVQPPSSVHTHFMLILSKSNLFIQSAYHQL